MPSTVMGIHGKFQLGGPTVGQEAYLSVPLTLGGGGPAHGGILLGTSRGNIAPGSTDHPVLGSA